MSRAHWQQGQGVFLARVDLRTTRVFYIAHTLVFFGRWAGTRRVAILCRQGNGSEFASVRIAKDRTPKFIQGSASPIRPWGSLVSHSARHEIVVVRFWHKADIGLCAAHVCF